MAAPAPFTAAEQLQQLDDELAMRSVWVVPEKPDAREYECYAEFTSKYAITNEDRRVACAHLAAVIAEQVAAQGTVTKISLREERRRFVCSFWA